MARSMQALEGMGRLSISQCCGVSCNRSVKVYRGESEDGCWRCKVAELTDQVRKAVRDDWRAHVDRQAVEAHNAASSDNSEQLYQVVKNLAR